MTSPAVTGGCLCGRVRYEADEAPSRTHYCHCRMCQRHFGNAFGMYTSFLTDRLRFTGERWLPFLEDCFDRLDTAAR